MGCLLAFSNLLLLIVLVCYILVFVIGLLLYWSSFGGCVCGLFVVCWLRYVWGVLFRLLWAVVCLLACLLRLSLVWWFCCLVVYCYVGWLLQCGSFGWVLRWICVWCLVCLDGWWLLVVVCFALVVFV